MEEREGNLAVEIIRLWKRPEIRKRYGSIVAFWDSFAYKGKSSEKNFKDTTDQAHIDAIKKKVEASSASREEIKTRIATAGAKIKPAPARQVESDNDSDTSDNDSDTFERLFFAHAAKLRALRIDGQKISACYPKLVEELEISITEISTSWTENNLEAFKAALSKTERIYKKAAVIVEAKHPLL
jgi:hypothetical protein